MPISEARKRANKKYNAKAKQIVLRIFPSEQDILAKILEVSEGEGYSPYIKRLIREDLKKEKGDK